MRQLVYSMLISNNRPYFHLWWKENLVKLQQVSKDYVNDSLQNFVLLFISLLPIKFFKNSHIWSKLYLIFRKNVLKQTWNCFNTKFQAQRKARKKQLPSKANFTTILLLNFSNSTLKQCGKTKSYQNCQRS